MYKQAKPRLLNCRVDIFFFFLNLENPIQEVKESARLRALKQFFFFFKKIVLIIDGSALQFGGRVGRL